MDARYGPAPFFRRGPRPECTDHAAGASLSCRRGSGAHNCPPTQHQSGEAGRPSVGCRRSSAPRRPLECFRTRWELCTSVLPSTAAATVPSARQRRQRTVPFPRRGVGQRRATSAHTPPGGGVLNGSQSLVQTFSCYSFCSLLKYRTIATVLACWLAVLACVPTCSLASMLLAYSYYSPVVAMQPGLHPGIMYQLICIRRTWPGSRWEIACPRGVGERSLCRGGCHALAGALEAARRRRREGRPLREH
jgi:hypothetical protein